MAVINDIFIDQGTDYSTIITVNGLNLTGYSVAAQIRRGFSSTNAVSFTATIYDAASGKIKLALNNNQTSAMKAGRYVYDVELTNPSGEKSRPIKGLVIVDPEVTR